MTYRPPGRSNRSGRATADNDVFEGLPVKQWGQLTAHYSLAPPKEEVIVHQHDRWGEPPMPRDHQLLHPWTQHLLRLARSGKVGNKRKQDHDSPDEDKPEDEAVAAAAAATAAAVAEDTKHLREERGYVAKRWKPIPEAALEPEHKHFEFLAKRRPGLPSVYGNEAQNGTAVPMRKTHVQRTGADGEVAIYEVLVPEGKSVEGEVRDTTELADIKPVSAAPGTVIEGVGVANDDGVLVAEHLKPQNTSRRPRPPPKKKGGPGRGKKRVTFTNPDGSTYTTIVPNATKIIPQPGQTVKHVAKGEEATADVSAEQAALAAANNEQGDHTEGGDDQDGDDGDEDGDEDGDDDDDHEDGEISEDDPPTATATPSLAEKSEADGVAPIQSIKEEHAEPGEMPDVLPDAPPASTPPTSTATTLSGPDVVPKTRETTGTPDVPLDNGAENRQTSPVGTSAVPLESVEDPTGAASDIAKADGDGTPLVTESSALAETVAETTEQAASLEPVTEPMVVDTETNDNEPAATSADHDDDLLGSLEKTLPGGGDAGNTETADETMDEQPAELEGQDQPAVDAEDKGPTSGVERDEPGEEEAAAETETREAAVESAE